MPDGMEEGIEEEHREISVAEFFEKNRHLLGFNNPQKAIITCIKEAVDNSVTWSTPVLIEQDGKKNVTDIGRFIDDLMEENRDKVQIERDGDLEKLHLDEEVKSLSFDSRDYSLDFKDVGTVFRHKVNSDIYRATLEGGRNVELTDYHSVFTLKDGYIRSEETSNLAEGDYAVIPQKGWDGSGIREINLIEELMELPRERTEKIGVYDVMPIIGKYRDEIEDRIEDNHRIQDFRKCDRLPFNLVRDLDIDLGELAGCRLGFRFGRNNIPATLSVNRDLAELLGVYTAEGSITGHRDGHDRVYFSLGSHEEELIDHLETLIRRVFDLDPSTVDAHETAVNVSINAKIVGLVLTEVFGLGEKADEKTLPRFVFDLDRDLRERFIIGYLAGDGYPTDRAIDLLRDGGELGKLSIDRFIASTSSRQLATELRYLLASIGIDTTFEERQGEVRNIGGRKAEFQESYALYIHTSQADVSRNKLPARHVLESVSDSRLRYNLDGRQSRVKTGHALQLQQQGGVAFKGEGFKIAQSDLTALPIKEIEKIDYDREWVYDVSVPGHENFMAGTFPIACHNSLDAAEKDDILPEIHVTVDEEGEKNLRFQVKDNAIGLSKDTIPNVFGKLLYSDKFHKLQQSLLPDQKILIRRNGEIRLEEIGVFCDECIDVDGTADTKIADEVEAPCFNRETGEITWRPVTHAIRHENRHETYRINTSRGRRIDVTGNHSLFTVGRGGGIEEVEAEQLEPGDYVLAPENIPTPETVDHVNLLDYVTADELAGQRWYVYGIETEMLERIRAEGEKIRKKASAGGRERTYYRFNDVDILKDSLEQNYLQDGYLPAEKILELGWEDRVRDCRLRTYQVGGDTTEIPAAIPITEDLMQFLGLYIAEGHTDERQVGLTFGGHETELVEAAEAAAAGTFNATTTTVERERNSTRLKVFGSPVAAFLENACGSGARNKKMPDFIFNAPAEKQQAFIDALYQGDGSDAHPSNELTFTTTSKPLAQQLSYLWQMRGVVASWKERTSEGISGKSTTTYDILIHGKDIGTSNVFDEDASKESRYRMIPAELVNDIALRETDDVRIRPTSAGIFKAIGLGSQIQYSENFVELVRTVMAEEPSQEDHYLDELRNRNLVDEEDRPTERLEEIWERTENLLSFAESDLCLLEVDNVEPIDAPKYVYDISVPGTGADENFIGGNQGALCVKNSRGQQGIGISAAGLYAQLTTGNPVKIYSRMKGSEDTHMFKVRIDTETNEPEVLEDRIVDSYEFEHGTSLEMEIEGQYTGGHHSVENYLKHTAIMNPYARVVLNEPDGNTTEYPRVTDQMPETPDEIRPHPHGVELGVLMRMIGNSSARTVKSFLQSEFTRVGRTSAEDIVEKTDLEGKERPNTLDKDQVEELLQAMQDTDLQNPPTNCISPLGEELIIEGLKKELNPEFVTAVTRKPAVYRGNPFQIEAAVAWGGDIEAEGSYSALRYANKVPLLYKKNACATTEAIRDTDWSRYGLTESGERPAGPVYILVHMASVWVPFTSEGKEAIATYPEIKKEMKLALQEAGRNLKRHISQKRKKEMQEKKAKKLSAYSKEMVPALAELAEMDREDVSEGVEALLQENYQVDEVEVEA